jgi:hypothetical protein
MDYLSKTDPIERLVGDSGDSGRSTPVRWIHMQRYLVTVFHAMESDLSDFERESMFQAIDALNEEMVTAGISVFAGDLHSPLSATWVQAESNRAVTITDGPYQETNEYIGAVWVLDAPDLDKALAWARKAAIACRAPIEVRPLKKERLPKPIPG